MQDGTKTTAPRPRGRPRRVEPSAALDRAIDAFWIGGYTGTSLDELSAATGLNRPSLYAAFGDKRQLYLTALARFVERMEAAVSTAMAEAPDLRNALARFYDGALDVYLSGDEPARGCFVICTAAVDAPEEPAIRDALQAVLTGIDVKLAARFKRAIAGGELPAGSDADALGTLAAATLHSLAIRARAGASRAALTALAKASINQLLRPAD